MYSETAIHTVDRSKYAEFELTFSKPILPSSVTTVFPTDLKYEASATQNVLEIRGYDFIGNDNTG